LEQFIYQDVLNRVGERIHFIPFIEMHEFEAFLFSDPTAYQNYEITPDEHPTRTIPHHGKVFYQNL
jgi:hypothetical protein